MYILNSAIIFLLISIQIKWIFGFSKQQFTNKNERKFPIFLIDFEFASVLCQHSNNPKDLHLHDISILCNGHQECFQSLFGQDDESFPHCRHLQCRGDTKKEVDCNGKGACIFNGFTTRCFCNEGYYGLNCEYFGNKNEEKEAFDEFGLEFGKGLNERKNWLKMTEIINEAKEANNKKQKEFGLLIGKGRMEMVEGGGHETSTKATRAYTERSLEPSSAANTEANKLATSETISASDSETSTKGYNTEATSILNIETTSASNSILYTETYTEAPSLSTSALNTEAPSIKNSGTSSILNLEASTKASREATSSSKTIAISLETVETTFINFEPKSEASTEATISLNTQINPVATLTVTELKSNQPNNEAILVDNEANFKSETEAPNKEENLLAKTEATFLSTIPTSIEEALLTKTKSASTKKFSTNEANFSSVETTSLADIEATSNNEAKSVSNIETSSEAGVEAKTLSSIEASSKANIEAEPVAGTEASSRSGIDASSKRSIEASSEATSIEAKPIASSEASSKGSIEATSIRSEVKDTKTSQKGNSLSANTATPLSNIDASSLPATDKIRSTSLTSKLEPNFISTVKPSFSNFETTVPSATNSRLNSNKLNTEATSESEAKAKFPFESEAKTKFPFEAEAKTKSSKSEASTKSLTKPSTSEAESPSKTDSLVNTSTEATSVANNIKHEALTIISTSFTPQISSLNTRRNFETNFASNNTFSYTEASQINNSETISATTLFPPIEATEPLINVSEANAYINNESTSKTKTEASPSLILVNSASSFKEATSIPKTEAGSNIANLASSASSFNEATSTKPTLSTTEANSKKNITDTSNRTSFKLINVSEASTMLPLETEIKLRFKSKARTKFFSKSEASTKFPLESEALKKSPSEAEASTKSFSKAEASKKSPLKSEASTKSHSEAEAETKSLSEYEAKVKTTESEAKMNSPSESETSTAGPEASTFSFKFETITKFSSEAEASTKSSTKSLASTNIFKNIEVNSSKATRKASTRSKEISFENFLNKIGARKLSTEKPKLSSENSEINLLNTTPFEAITEANRIIFKPTSKYETNLINNEATSTKIIKTEAETNQNIETNTESTLEAKLLVSNFEAKSEATSEIYSKNVENITEAPLSLANTTNLGVNVAATTSEADSVTNREFEQTTTLAGIEATTVANIVATSIPVASIEATSLASNQAISTIASNGAASEARIEAISTPEASIKATPVASNEATSLSKVNATSASNIEARMTTNIESTSLINSRTRVVSTSAFNEASLKPALLVFDKNTKENMEANSVAFSTAKFVAAENTKATNANDATTSSTASSSFTPSSFTSFKQINSTLEANLKANEVKTKTEATSLNTEASFVASTFVANIETASTIINTEANFNGTTSATENSEANFTSSRFISKATESSTASNIFASRFKINSEATTVATLKTTLKTPRRFTKLQNCLQNWTRLTTHNVETASTTIKPPIVEASSPNVSPNKTTVSGADSTVPLPSKNIRVVSHQNHTISPLKISSSVVSTNFELSLNASSNSLKNLECFNNTDSKCGSRCENGYFLNSNGVAVCGKEAFCRNLEGAYRCECPKILKEDGHECAALSPKSIKEYIQVKCFRRENLENSAIQVLFTSNVWKQFKGRVIVNGSQAENQKCFKDFSSNNSNNNNFFNFLIPANDCKLIEKGIKINTLSTRLLIKPIIELKSFNYLYIPPIYFIQIQCHFTEEEENLANFSKNFTKINKMTTKMEITKTPKRTSQKVFEDVFDKKMRWKTTKEPLKEKMEANTEQIKIKEKLTTLKTKITKESIRTTTKNNFVGEPICLLNVTDKNGVHVLKIKAGETLTLTLSLVSRLWQQKIRNITIFPKRCYAINLDNGGRYCLTDNGAFRWTETNTVRFECDCSVCSEEKCPKFDCEKRRNFRFKKYFYNNWALNENDESSVGYENLANLTWLSRPSSLPVIMEVDDENKRKRRRRKRRKV
uniref:EGF-like domain-containing protein n=1 Tax=Meloidogyne floridensis TaxID=298350 RepID=A0A915P0Q3_9BILA